MKNKFLIMLGFLFAVASSVISFQAAQSGNLVHYGLSSVLFTLSVLLLRDSKRYLTFVIFILIGGYFAGGFIRATALDFSVYELASVTFFIALLIIPVCMLHVVKVKRYQGVVTSILALFILTSSLLSLTGQRHHFHPIVKYSSYVTMSDGVEIALDYFLPRGNQNSSLPTIVTFTRYHRATALHFPFNILFSPSSGNRERFGAAGYATVVADVRGSGASFGSRPSELFEREIVDYYEIVDWIVDQPWSNGKVGAEGVSYSGSSAEQLMLKQHPAVLAIAPQYSLFDAYTDAALPGGLMNKHISIAWGEMLAALDSNQPIASLPIWMKWFYAGVMPVNNDYKKLEQAITSRDNYRGDKLVSLVEYRDDRIDNTLLFNGSIGNKIDQFAKTTTPMLLVSGWNDGGYQQAAFRKWLNRSKTNIWVVIGPWDHGPYAEIDPCKGDDIGRRYRSDITLPFFNHFLKQTDSAFSQTPRIRYYTLCGNTWKSANDWPVFSKQKELKLVDTQLNEDTVQASGKQRLVVSTQATTGGRSRWSSLVPLPGKAKTYYADRSSQTKFTTQFTSLPLKENTTITGHPKVALQLSSESSDGALFVYLEDLAPDGTITYVTEGQLRLSQYRVSALPMYKDYTPVRNFLRSEARDFPIEQITKVEVGLLPISYQFKVGHQIQLSIAGADSDNFLPLETNPEYLEIHWSPQNTSVLYLPIEDESKVRSYIRD